MTKDIWLKLITYEVAKNYNCGIAYATKKIDEYNLATDDNLELRWVLFHTPEYVATCLITFFKKREDEQNKKEAEERKKAMQERRDKWAKIKGKLKNTPAKFYPKNSLEFQLGLYIGDDIVKNYLPCLSIDGDTNNPIEVSDEDTMEYEKVKKALDAIEFDNRCEESPKWKEYITFRKMLYKKYLPESIDCWVNRIESVMNMNDLKSGIQVALCDSDVCSYNTDIIEIRNDEVMLRSIVTIYRDKKVLI